MLISIRLASTRYFAVARVDATPYVDYVQYILLEFTTEAVAIMHYLLEKPQDTEVVYNIPETVFAPAARPLPFRAGGCIGCRWCWRECRSYAWGGGS